MTSAKKDIDLNQFSDPKTVEILVKKIKQLAKPNKSFNIMEVCGTHTMSIARSGLRSLLPQNIKLLSGPGCPVCVTPNKSIDYMLALADLPNVIIATFGDMMRVPGTSSSLIEKRASGKDIRVIYSPLDCLEIAQKNPAKHVLFLGVGFETTAPTTAATIKRAKKMGIENFSVYCAHKNMPNALRLIAKDPDISVNGLLLPGHVSTIIGTEPYQFLADTYNIGGVVAGFEPVDILQAIYMLLAQDSPKIEVAYTRGVREQGNITAQNLIDEVFNVCLSTWRGIGQIESSGYTIKDEYGNFDATKRFSIKDLETKENSACKCGDVLKGIIKPTDCPLFAKLCNPQNPVGPCMVSSEGTCSAYYKYLK